MINVEKEVQELEEIRTTPPIPLDLIMPGIVAYINPQRDHMAICPYSKEVCSSECPKLNIFEFEIEEGSFEWVCACSDSIKKIGDDTRMRMMYPGEDMLISCTQSIEELVPIFDEEEEDDEEIKGDHVRSDE